MPVQFAVAGYKKNIYFFSGKRANNNSNNGYSLYLRNNSGVWFWKGKQGIENPKSKLVGRETLEYWLDPNGWTYFRRPKEWTTKKKKKMDNVSKWGKEVDTVPGDRKQRDSFQANTKGKKFFCQNQKFGPILDHSCMHAQFNAVGEKCSVNKKF